MRETTRIKYFDNSVALIRRSFLDHRANWYTSHAMNGNNYRSQIYPDRCLQIRCKLLLNIAIPSKLHIHLRVYTVTQQKWEERRDHRRINRWAMTTLLALPVRPIVRPPLILTWCIFSAPSSASSASSPRAYTAVPKASTTKPTACSSCKWSL